MTWICETDDGEQVHLDHAPQPIDGAFVRVSQSKFDPDPRGTDRWDFDAKRWITDQDRVLALIDQDHARDCGATSISDAHTLKAIEATLIAAGIAVPGGLIEAEAFATGSTSDELAEAVLTKYRAATLQPEVARIVAKREARLA